MGIKEFLQKFAADSEFAAKYQALKGAEAFLAQAKADGYSITKEELEALFQKTESGELSDDELEAAAGGNSYDGVPTLRELLAARGKSEEEIDKEMLKLRQEFNEFLSNW